jgi:cytochrome c biogenesis protein CcmG/thiol:disulfide interchange protein DsbE
MPSTDPRGSSRPSDRGVDAERTSGSEPTAEPASEEAARGRRGPLRLAGSVLGSTAVVGLVGLLAYGLIARSPNTSIDDSLARDRPIRAPSYRLTVLERGRLGSRLERTVGPALRDGWLSPRELLGTPYVLNLWASWCVPCRDEAPELVRAWRRSRPLGVLFVGLNMQDIREDARDFMHHFDVDYLNIRDPTNDTARQYGATGIPETFFISARGEVVNHVIGVVTPRQLRDGIAAARSGRTVATVEGGDRRPAR